MPLVVPGLMSKDGGDKTQKWQSELMGKKLGDSSDNVVCDIPSLHQNRQNVNWSFVLSLQFKPAGRLLSLGLAF